MIPNPNGNIYQPSPYPNQLLGLVDAVCLTLFRISRFFLDNLGCCFLPITPEKRNMRRFYLWSAIKVPFLFLGFCLSIPNLILAIVVYSLIFDSREKHRISTCDTITQEPKPKKTYGFATSNFCGHYEYFDRINNLSNTRKRLLEIGERIRSSQIKYMQSEARISADNRPPKSRRKLDDAMDVSIKADFPETDFLLCQEVIFPEHGAEFARTLHAVYPYILYDPCDHGLGKNYLLSGADTVIASKYPVLHARFQRFEQTSTVDRITSKGLLQAKVHLGDEDGKRLVGYLSNTHMQVYQGSSMARYHQFDDIVRWTKEYREILRDPNEVIVFDVVAGDFNMCNMSPVDKADWAHPLFDVYEDVGREKAGKDKDFTVGTEMRQSTLYDPSGTTPDSLKESLEDPGMLRWHVLDGDIEEITMAACFEMPPVDGTTGKVIPSECGGRRRVDYVLTRKEDTVTARAYNAVTALAGLTDHIAISLTVDVVD